jgi:hypothetical protein
MEASREEISNGELRVVFSGLLGCLKKKRCFLAGKLDSVKIFFGSG